MLIAKGFELDEANPNDVWQPRDEADWLMRSIR